MIKKKKTVSQPLTTDKRHHSEATLYWIETIIYANLFPT